MAPWCFIPLTSSVVSFIAVSKLVRAKDMLMRAKDDLAAAKRDESGRCVTAAALAETGTERHHSVALLVLTWQNFCLFWNGCNVGG